MLKSLRYRLLAWFLIFILLIVSLFIPANLLYRRGEKRINRVTLDLNAVYVNFLKDTKAVSDFLTLEPVNADFFIHGQSAYLDYHLQLTREIETGLSSIRQLRHIRAFNINNQLDLLSENLHHYNILFDSLVYLVYKRGFKNFGLEGELYDYGRMLERDLGIDQSKVYLLRQIENNYFFKNDTSSVTLFAPLIADIRKEVSGNQLLQSAVRNTTIELLNNYTQAFNRLIVLDRQTGTRKNVALKASLNKQGDHIENLFAGLLQSAVITQNSLIHTLNFYYIFSLLVIFGLSILFSFVSSRHVVSNLEALTDYISVLVKNNPEQHQTIDLRNSAREIRQIYREFRNLLSQLKIWETQRNKALQNAEETQQRYQELADMLPQSVFETNSLGNYTYVNKAWYKTFGYTENDLDQGLNLIETLISESNQENILGQQKIENSYFLAIRKDGSRFPASVYTDNIIKDGAISGRRGIIVDITDKINYIRSLQQETSKARTSDELKSSFLANMSHEIRTPMNSIIGFSNLLASEQIPDPQKKDFVNYIRNSSEILLNLVDDIIDIAKIEAGELKIIKKECEIIALGEELVTTAEEVRKKFHKQHINLIFKPPENLPELILKTDPFRLRQILINLLNNAIKFTENGFVEFGFNIVQEGKFIEFYVKDTGIGLSREELDMVFQRFKRTSRSVEKNIVGTGLGLAISKNLVQLMGGELWVDSAQGHGTTFIFTLPYLKTTPIGPNVVEKHYHDSMLYNWTGKTVLIVEDDPGNFNLLNELLKKTNVAVLQATTGKKAIEICRTNSNLDLVIMDIQLPEMDGLEATKMIKKIRNNLPVIAQTAFAMAGDKEKYKQSGFDEYVSKPIDIKVFLSIVNHFLTDGASQPFQKISPADTEQNQPPDLGYVVN